MTLRDALAAALAPLIETWPPVVTDRERDREMRDRLKYADAILSDPAFREGLTEALAAALDAEEDEVGFTVYEAWPSAHILVARMLGEEK